MFFCVIGYLLIGVSLDCVEVIEMAVVVAVVVVIEVGAGPTTFLHADEQATVEVDASKP